MSGFDRSSESEFPFRLRIDVPEGETGFAEFRRAVSVQGRILSSSGEDVLLPENVGLTVLLSEADGEKRVLRNATADSKNSEIDPLSPGLLCCPESEDPGFSALRAFGFPEAIPPRYYAGNKCWFSDGRFKAVIVSATDPETGAVWEDGMSMRDGNGLPFKVLPEGEYVISAVLYDRTTNEVLGRADKPLTIGIPPVQAIFRFHPDAHREAISAWCKENGYACIHDPLPGYLDPYLGEWKQHMGFLTMYRANDIAMFADPKTSVRMFVYLIDPTSTSYETELAFLQEVGALAQPGRFQAFRYDVGEAEIPVGKEILKGKILSFEDGETVCLCRRDLTSEEAKEGEYFVDGRHLSETVPVVREKEIPLPADKSFALMGVVCPWQMDPADFLKRPDNTYEILNAPDSIEYVFRFAPSGEGEEEVMTFLKPVGLERFAPDPVGGSVFEFYHFFRLPERFRGRKGTLSVRVLDRKKEPAPGVGAAYPFSVD